MYNPSSKHYLSIIFHVAIISLVKVHEFVIGCLVYSEFTVRTEGNLPEIELSGLIMFERRSCKEILLITMKSILPIACVVHIGFIGYNIVYPDIPSIHVYDKQLSEIDFPISFRVCAHESNKSKEYKKYGYYGKGEFFSGKSMYNKSLIGWAGHSENGSTLSTFKG